MNTECKLKGEYRCVLKRKDDIIKDTGYFDNLLLDNFFVDLTSVTSLIGGYGRYIRVGTGTTPPDVTQTTLQNLLASTQTTITTTQPAGSVSGGFVTGYAEYEMSFPLGSVVGNITEVGWGTAYKSLESGTVYSRALITDAGGTPTPLTVTADDQLVVFYRLNLSSPAVDLTGSFILDGVTYNYIGRFAAQSILRNMIEVNTATMSVGGSASTLGSHGVAASTSGGGISSASPVFTNNANGTRTYTYNFSITQGNSTGTPNGIKIMTNSYHKYEFTPVIPKDNTKTLSLKFTESYSRA